MRVGFCMFKIVMSILGFILALIAIERLWGFDAGGLFCGLVVMYYVEGIPND